MGSKVATIAVLLFLFSALCSGQSPPPPAKCPDLKVCAKLLGGMLNLNVGPQQTEPCCSLLGGVADLDAAVCLCTTIRASILGINLNVDKLLVQLLVNSCGRELPEGFKCPT